MALESAGGGVVSCRMDWGMQLRGTSDGWNDGSTEPV